MRKKFFCLTVQKDKKNKLKAEQLDQITRHCKVIIQESKNSIAFTMDVWSGKVLSSIEQKNETKSVSKRVRMLNVSGRR